MDMEQIVAMGAQLFKNSGGATQQLNESSISSALTDLLSNGGNGIDLAGLVSSIQGSGLAGLAESWLGDGTNASVSSDQIANIFSSDQLSAFTEKLGISTEDASAGLAKVVPEMVDKSSSAGALLESIGGISGALQMAANLFGKK